MHVQSALPIVPRPSSRRPQVAPRNGSIAYVRRLHAVECVGYLVGRAPFAGRVQSVFAQACNVTRDGVLLTLCTARVGTGPLTVHLADGGPEDLREWFEAGEAVDGTRGGLRTPRVELRWTQEVVWKPAELGVLLDAAGVEARVGLAASGLAQFRRARPSIVDGAGAGVAAALRQACARLDAQAAAQQVERLVGWGEGVTPAGDDFLVGLLAGLDALVRGDIRRRAFRDALAATLVGFVGRTTAISAHYLRLAAGGHYGEPLVSLRIALIAEPHDDAVAGALRNALAVGATSGADTASGLLAGLSAWAAPVSADARA